jgi:hypothetical protein
MTNAEARIVHLEQELRQLMLTNATMQAQIAALQQAVRTTTPGSPYGQTGGSGGIFIMAGVVIAAGASITGATVDYVIGGTGIVASTNATVWNMMQSATVSGKTIVLGLNPDNSFTVITQSC